MSDKAAIYDTASSTCLSLPSLLSIYSSLGVSRIIFKQLSPNDNSKNQPYLAGHLTDLGFLPTGEISASNSASGKTGNLKRKVKYTATLDLSWISSDGAIFPAPRAKVIYYPQYPEVRLSGFVAGCQFDMGGWMDPASKGRAQGRILFMGIAPTGKIYTYLAVPESRIVREIDDYPSAGISGVLRELDTDHCYKGDSKNILLTELKRIHQKGWIESKRLDKAGTVMKYRARNGGGYTLEAELGVIPNGIADPDFMGWEIKQFAVKKCHLINSKPLTLMTPEPDGGYYVEQGVLAFIRKYGYLSPTISDRLDFTGRHFCNEPCAKSGLTLVTIGYDSKTNAIIDSEGYIALIDSRGNVASSWSIAKLMGHWKRKHARAAYIPALSQNNVDKTRSYAYCNNVRLFEGASIRQLLRAITEQDIYYDPGIKLVDASGKASIKRRSQFRIKSSSLHKLYINQENIDLLTV